MTIKKISACPVHNPPNYVTKFENKQKLLAVASGQDVSWGGSISSGFNDPGTKPKYPRFCLGIQ
jgi:hypothetical protein